MNEIENKEIEEMAHDIYWEEKDCDILTKSGCEDLAEILIGLGYRNVKDKVVLTKEELDKINELNAKNIKREQEATARDIIDYVRYSFIHNRREFLKDLEKLEKEYGMEVE